MAHSSAASPHFGIAAGARTFLAISNCGGTAVAASRSGFGAWSLELLWMLEVGIWTLSAPSILAVTVSCRAIIEGSEFFSEYPCRSARRLAQTKVPREPGSG